MPDVVKWVELATALASGGASGATISGWMNARARRSERLHSERGLAYVEMLTGSSEVVQVLSTVSSCLEEALSTDSWDECDRLIAEATAELDSIAEEMPVTRESFARVELFGDKRTMLSAGEWWEDAECCLAEVESIVDRGKHLDNDIVNDWYAQIKSACLAIDALKRGQRVLLRRLRSDMQR